MPEENSWKVREDMLITQRGAAWTHLSPILNRINTTKYRLFFFLFWGGRGGGWLSLTWRNLQSEWIGKGQELIAFPNMTKKRHQWYRAQCNSESHLLLCCSFGQDITVCSLGVYISSLSTSRDCHRRQTAAPYLKLIEIDTGSSLHYKVTCSQLTFYSSLSRSKWELFCTFKLTLLGNVCNLTRCRDEVM